MKHLFARAVYQDVLAIYKSFAWSQFTRIGIRIDEAPVSDFYIYIYTTCMLQLCLIGNSALTKVFFLNILFKKCKLTIRFLHNACCKANSMNCVNTTIDMYLDSLCLKAHRTNFIVYERIFLLYWKCTLFQFMHQTHISSVNLKLLARCRCKISLKIAIISDAVFIKVFRLSFS